MSGMERVNIPEKLNASEIIHLTARLAQLLAEEVDLLGEMKIKKIEALQKEKLFLTSALEAHKKMLTRNPQLIDTIPSQDRRDLEGVVTVFEDILQENHRRLLRAKEVNMKIVQAVTEAVKDHSVSRVYGDNGVQGALGTESISITLNQTA